MGALSVGVSGGLGSAKDHLNLNNTLRIFWSIYGRIEPKERVSVLGG